MITLSTFIDDGHTVQITSDDETDISVIGVTRINPELFHSGSFYTKDKIEGLKMLIKEIECNHLWSGMQ